MKGTALIISKMKGIRKICSQMFPFQKKKKWIKIKVIYNWIPLNGEKASEFC